MLDRSKLKALADDKINVTQKLKLDIRREEDIVGKGENGPIGSIHTIWQVSFSCI